MDIKLLSMALVLGIPLIGIYLLTIAMSSGNDVLMAIAVIMILLFPLVVSANVLRAKTVSGRR